MHPAEKWYCLHINYFEVLFVVDYRELTASDLRKKLMTKGVTEAAAGDAVAYLVKR